MKIKIVLIAVFFLLVLFFLPKFFESELPEEFVCGNEVFDIDGNRYKTVRIGGQCWFAENLRTTRYSNKSRIQYIEDNDDWWTDDEGAFTLYDYTAPPHYSINSAEEMLETYGYLYNFNAVVNEKGLCPEGWLVPSDEDWKILEIELGMSEEEADNYWHRGTVEGDMLKGGQGLWDEIEEFGITGFNALPGGYRRNYGDFGNIGTNANFWTSTASGDKAIRRNLYWEDSGVYRIITSKGNGLSVRCMMPIDNATESETPDRWDCGSLVLYNGEDYRTVKIGDQCWFGENLKTKEYRNGNPILNPTSDLAWRDARDNKEGAYSS